MSQPGSTEPATSSLDRKPSLPPAKVSAEDEAEEGEILDEEEGEISEGQPADSAASVTTPLQPSSATAADASEPSAEQPLNAEPSTGDSAVSEVKPQDDDKALPSASAPTDDVAPTSAQATQQADAAEATTQPAQQSAETDTIAGSTTEATAVPASIPELVQASSSAPIDITKQLPEAVEETPAPQEAQDTSTPKLTEAQAPKPDETAAAASTVQDQTMEDAPTAVTIPTPTEAQPEGGNTGASAVEAESKADAPADMDVDEKVVVQPSASKDAAEQTADSVHDAMQVDSTVHTPALPSDGPETPRNQRSHCQRKTATSKKHQRRSWLRPLWRSRARHMPKRKSRHRWTPPSMLPRSKRHLSSTRHKPAKSKRRKKKQAQTLSKHALSQCRIKESRQNRLKPTCKLPPRRRQDQKRSLLAWRGTSDQHPDLRMSKLPNPERPTQAQPRPAPSQSAASRRRELKTALTLLSVRKTESNAHGKRTDGASSSVSNANESASENVSANPSGTAR